MRMIRLADLDGTDTSVLARVAPDHRVGEGGVTTLAPGERSHPQGRHVHAYPEVFLILEGSGTVEIDGTPTAIAAGDVLVVDPGEDHHLTADAVAPLVTSWLDLVPIG
jgi:quercetin dioxygenase-like cupin family protein